MNMKEHILTALREQFDGWEALLASLSAAQISAHPTPSDWSIKDEIAHLMAWQQRSNVRLQAALSKQPPEFPVWRPELQTDADENVDQVNLWIYEAHRDMPWSTIHASWRSGCLSLLESAAAISERDLLDSGLHPWMNGSPLASVLLGTYDHHQEHFEQLLARLSRSAK
jgi:hypothetical protein